jgi:predicted amidohydrolase
VWEDKAASHARVRTLLAASPAPEGALLVLPEMFSTGFSMNVEAIHEGEARVSERFLAQTAREHRIFVTGGVVTRGADARGRNQSLTFDPDGQEIARYSKIHPFTFGTEAAHYSAGESPVMFSCSEFRVAPFVCYDLRFPEVFRNAVRRGAQLYTVIASWPQSRIEHWIALLRARAIENQAYVVGVNRCGVDPKLTYNGRSLIIDPGGAILADAGNGECLVSADLDLTALQEYRRAFPFLADIHPEFVPAESCRDGSPSVI